jgi:hypothetical protein
MLSRRTGDLSPSWRTGVNVFDAALPYASATPTARARSVRLQLLGLHTTVLSKSRYRDADVAPLTALRPWLVARLGSRGHG